MATPIVLNNPVVHLEDVDAPGSPVDVSCDISRIELRGDQPINTVRRLCGNVSVPGSVDYTATADMVHNDDSASRWGALVGKTVKVTIWPTPTASAGTTFQSFVGYDWTLTGSWENGEPFSVPGFTLPVLAAPEAHSGAVPGP